MATQRTPARSDDSSGAPAEEPGLRRRPAPIRVARRIPATLGLVVLLLAVGVISGGLWSSFSTHPWFDTVAYGLPALGQGRWWAPITGTFFVIQPWVYVPTLLAFLGMGYLEYRRGTGRALATFGIGQLAGVLLTSLFVFSMKFTGWPWAVSLATVSDVGPSPGAMACIAAAVGLFAVPWRQRAWIVVFGFAAVSLLFLGTLADVEHAFAILLVLIVDRSFRPGRTSVRETRLLAVASMIALTVISLVVMLIPTNGPFGQTTIQPVSVSDVVFDAAVALIAILGLRRGRRWGWIIAMLLALLNLLIAVLALIVLLVAPQEAVGVVGDVDVTLATGVLWTAYGIFLIVARRAFRLWRRRPITAGAELVTDDEVRDLIRTEGGGTLSWMTTWEGMNYLRTEGGIVPFQAHAGAAIVLADPLGPAGSLPGSAREFVRTAEQHALAPCFFSASRATRDALPHGWRAMAIADDTLVDLAGLTFQGKAWSKVRQSFSRAGRDNMTFRLTRLADEPFAVRAQLQAISEQWVGDKGLPEMRFTLGTLAEAEDPEVRIALAVDPQGNIDGVLSWLPVYEPGGAVRGWTLDVMRRRDGGFPAVMEFLIGSSAKAFAEEGAKVLSLSGAPLAHEGDENTGAIADLLARLGAMLEPVYGFRSLHQFKKKFNPRYEPIYLLYRDEGDLPAIGRGLTQAFLPDATLRQYAAAGLELARGSK